MVCNIGLEFGNSDPEDCFHLSKSANPDEVTYSLASHLG